MIDPPETGVIGSIGTMMRRSDHGHCVKHPTGNVVPGSEDAGYGVPGMWYRGGGADSTHPESL